MKNNRESLETTRETPKRKFTESHKQHISDARKGKHPWNYHLTKDDPRVAKYTQTRIESPNYEQYKHKLSVANMGHSSTFTRKHTQETKDKMSAANAGRKHDYKVWNDGLTTETSPKLKSVGENISKALLALPKEKRIEMARYARSKMKPSRISIPEKI